MPRKEAERLGLTIRPSETLLHAAGGSKIPQAGKVRCNIEIGRGPMTNEFVSTEDDLAVLGIPFVYLYGIKTDLAKRFLFYSSGYELKADPIESSVDTVTIDKDIVTVNVPDYCLSETFDEDLSDDDEMPDYSRPTKLSEYWISMAEQYESDDCCDGSDDEFCNCATCLIDDETDRQYEEAKVAKLDGRARQQSRPQSNQSRSLSPTTNAIYVERWSQMNSFSCQTSSSEHGRTSTNCNTLHCIDSAGQQPSAAGPDSEEADEALTGPEMTGPF